MSRIFVVVSEVPSEQRVELLTRLRKITGLSFGHLSNCVESGEPLTDYVLFHNDHEDVQAELRQLLALVPAVGATLRFIETLDEDGEPPPVAELPEITPEMLGNMLDAHDERSQWRQRMWDEHGHI